MKLYKYLSIALVALTATSCTEDLMDDINENHRNPSAEVVDAKFEFPGIIMTTGFSTISGNYAFYTGSYTEQEFGTGALQLARAELRNSGETAASSTFDNAWNETYSTLHALKEAIDKCADGGVNAGQKDILGVAQVLTALNVGVLTDLHGAVPYSEALQGQVNLTPKLDSQESIYNEIFTLLDAAIDNLQNADDNNLGAQDILFNGDADQWIGLAYALKARYKLHTQYRNSNAVAEAYAAAQAAVEAGFDGAELDVFDDDNNNNPWTAFFWSREYTGSSKTVADLLSERQDPRYDAYVCPFFDTFDVGTPGDAQSANSTETLAAPSWLNNGGATIHFFSKSELYFIIAECQARLGADAREAFNTAVVASIEDYVKADAGTMGISAANAASYAASRPVTLKEIFVQKYIAQTRDEQIEAYNDIRRCKALGEEYITLQNSRNTQSGANAWPLRLPYAESDVRSNPNVRTAFGSGNSAGAYVFTNNVWWAGGND